MSLHGFPDDGHSFDAQLPALAEAELAKHDDHVAAYSAALLRNDS